MTYPYTMDLKITKVKGLLLFENWSLLSMSISIGLEKNVRKFLVECFSLLEVGRSFSVIRQFRLLGFEGVEQKRRVAQAQWLGLRRPYEYEGGGPQLPVQN